MSAQDSPSFPGASTLTPTPDPTVLTTEALERAMISARDYVDGQIAIVRESLRGMDRATELLSTTLNNAPSVITREIESLSLREEEIHKHLRELMDEKFRSIGTQFAERDTRQERESRDNKIAVDAAFAAQALSANRVEENFSKAIDKSEKSTNESIASVVSQVGDLKDRDLNDIKNRLSRMESIRQGGRENQQDSARFIGIMVGIIGTIIGVASVLLSVLLR